MMPATLPCRRSQLTKASAIALTDAPRSAPNTLDPPRPWFSAISCAVTSQEEACPLVETSTRRVRRPLLATMSRMKRNSAPLVSSVPTTSTTGGPELCIESGSRLCRAASSSRVTPIVTVRAAASMRAIGTGCDQRVGSTGLEMKIRTGPLFRAGCGVSRASVLAGPASRSAPRSPWVPTPSRRCCSSRSAASRAESMIRLTRPLTMMATFLETAVATPIFCSITSTDMSPSSPRRTSISSTWATMTGARPSVGSSMISKLGLVSSAREIASICCSPPESWLPP